MAEAIQSMQRHLFSWATVKAYYSVFYFLRSSIASRGYGLVRNKSIYLFHIQAGMTPLKKTNHSYRNDHLAVISIYRDLYAASDILQSNTIDGCNSYEWMMDRRNQIHYRQQQFYDPQPLDFLELIAQAVDARSFDTLISAYVHDSRYLYCFQSEHAALALPIQRMLLTRDEYAYSSSMPTLTQDRIHTITTLLTMDLTPLQCLQSFMLPGSLQI